MAVEQTTIQGTVLDPTGTPLTGGYIDVRLSSRTGTAPDGANEELIGGKARAPISSAGAVSFTLVPNDVITPSGTHWVATVVAPDGTSWEKLWNLATAPDPINIGDIPAP